MRADRYGFFHDSAAGDFLLMSRAMAHAIRGYPEIPTNIMIDGTAIHAAAAHGYGQLLFADDCVIFHQVLFLRVRGCRPTALWLWHEACRFSLPEHLLVFLCRSVTLPPSSPLSPARYSCWHSPAPDCSPTAPPLLPDARSRIPAPTTPEAR